MLRAGSRYPHRDDLPALCDVAAQVLLVLVVDRQDPVVAELADLLATHAAVATFPAFPALTSVGVPVPHVISSLSDARGGVRPTRDAPRGLERDVVSPVRPR